MKIKFIDILNFRKLKNCRINISEKETLLVGANNSGKTSATDALINFLDTEKSKRFSVTDFTLDIWGELNLFSKSWVNEESPQEVIGDSIIDWLPFCPTLDVWIDASTNEIQYVANLIPSFQWKGEPLGVRLVFQPKNIEQLKIDYLRDYKAAKKLTEKNPKLSLWPRDIKDYLARELKKHFEVTAYLLDSSKNDAPQILEKPTPLESYPFDGIFKVDVIEAQRGFSDPNGENSKSNGSLSSQLNEYYHRHLNPSDLPEEDDLKALEAIDSAQTLFDERLEYSFKSALGEIKKLGYPGFNDPDIKLSSKVNPIESLNHDAAVIFDIQKNSFNNFDYSLPEKYNGLGYKNLIHMVFKLITFRDKWQRLGKAKKHRTEVDIAIEPIHLVLIEEPEAHLHAQVQQIFIRKAYEVLRKNVKNSFTTQMIVSSHSSYIALEAGFEKLRYFKRVQAVKKTEAPSAKVIDLSNVFGGGANEAETKKLEDTKKFVTRYLKTTHCDLFFANGIILVEGAAERMLLPEFIRKNYPDSLHQSYLSILEVGGAHAQRLRPLIDKLGLPTLIITDTDAVESNFTKSKKVQPKRNNSYGFGSDTLKDWFKLKGKTLDQVLDLDDKYKVIGNVRAAYQVGIKVDFNDNDLLEEAIPYTFEDAIALTNIGVFRDLTESTGMVKKMHLATKEPTLALCCEKLYDSLQGEKAKMALDLLYEIDTEILIMPDYIRVGLGWLDNQLICNNEDYSTASDINSSKSLDANNEK
jgi:predicted ATP-dependent endonuclease of OLD family